MKIDRDLSAFQLNKANQAKQVLQAGKTKDKDTIAYNAKLRNACDGFEEIFVHKMIQVMRGSADKDPLISGGRGEEIFQDMLDENYAKLMTQNRSLGLSDLIYEQTKKN